MLGLSVIFLFNLIFNVNSNLAESSATHVFWRSLKSWSPSIGKVFLTDISDTVALR